MRIMLNYRVFFFVFFFFGDKENYETLYRVVVRSVSGSKKKKFIQLLRPNWETIIVRKIKDILQIQTLLKDYLLWNIRSKCQIYIYIIYMYIKTAMLSLA